jgi:hypothetical protein
MGTSTPCVTSLVRRWLVVVQFVGFELTTVVCVLRHPLHAVGHPVIPVCPVQLGHRHQMVGQVLRHSHLLQTLFPILGRYVGIGDLAV